MGGSIAIGAGPAAGAGVPAGAGGGPAAGGGAAALVALCAIWAPTLPAVPIVLAAADTAPVPIRADVSAIPAPALAPPTARLTPDAAPLPVPAAPAPPLPVCAPVPDTADDGEPEAGAPDDAGDADDDGADDIGRIADPKTDAGLPPLDAGEPAPPVEGADAAGGIADFPASPCGAEVASRALTSSGNRLESCAAWDNVGSSAWRVPGIRSLRGSVPSLNVS